MSKLKTPSVTSDQYDSLRLDNLAYVNIPEESDPQDYLNPTLEPGRRQPTPKVDTYGPIRTTRESERGSHPGPAPPPRDPNQTPPPPKRDDSIASTTDSVRAFPLLNAFSMPSISKTGDTPLPSETNPWTATKDKSPPAVAKSNSFGSAGARTKVFRREPVLPATPPIPPNAGREKVILKQKNSAFDSGVGDLDRIHIEDGRPKTYDYADYGHQYEELPNRKSIAKCPGDSGIDSRSELYQSSGGTTDVGSDVGDMANIVNAQTEKRKRVNPLYDGMTQSMPSIYSKGKDVKDVGLRRQVRCLKCALIVLVVVSCASLAVGLYAVISNLPAKDEADPLTPRVNKLSEDYSKLEHLLELFDDSSNDTQQVLSNLMHQIRTLNANMTSKVIGLQSQLDTLAHDHALDLQDAHDNLTQTITMLNLTLQMQLHNLSKQEGPRGPQGVANFTLCSYYNITEDAVPSDTFPTYTMWTPTEHTLETHIALYSACSVDGGTETLQEVNAITTKKVQYRCRCNGLISGKDRRRCTVHIMLCPRES